MKNVNEILDGLVFKGIPAPLDLDSKKMMKEDLLELVLDMIGKDEKYNKMPQLIAHGRNQLRSELRDKARKVFK